MSKLKPYLNFATSTSTSTSSDITRPIFEEDPLPDNKEKLKLLKNEQKFKRKR